MNHEKYFVTTSPIDNRERFGSNVWNSLEVSIFENKEEGDPVKIGSYERNYPTLFKTFHPFTKDGKDFALYSPDYTATRVMELPSCNDIAGEDRNTMGFCPVEYYVPKDENEDARFAFISGCVWGDDSSWKVQYLDLSRIENGEFSREERFGYHELPNGVSLADAVTIYRGEEEHFIEIATYATYRTNKKVDEVETFNNTTNSWNTITP